MVQPAEDIKRCAPRLARMYAEALNEDNPMTCDSYAPLLSGILQSLRRLLDFQDQQWFDAMLDRATQETIKERGLVTDRQRFFRLLDRAGQPRSKD